MDKIYRTVHRYGEEEIIINKSRFIGHSMPVEKEDDALEFIDKIKSEHRDATHNVYAYVVGKNSNIQRFSDDGEPSGTGGIPVLEVIKKENLRNVVIVVTRYFGGIKLGAGGLIRAYTKGAKVGLESGTIIDKILHTRLKIRIDYTLYGMIENYLNTEGYIIDNITYDEAVNIFVYIKFLDVEYFQKTITDLTSGNVTIEYIDEEYIAMKDGKIIR
ncbi:YigZ family protein [Schnuerera sp. xch1]|uniref:YigZ family protein n=1 Tax=Schnuerera sp. xch1 TaxID=2874283 RepID=UPI001CBAF000|nr:YigZ family protein [Schnuerera sp. xch1]MBZ2173643.1 YigZ family protein [Schnuerera sp. xch1]